MTPAADRIDSIQMLRAFAALAVVKHHIPLLGGNGAWGVDLFFVISGFIMCYVTAASGRDFFLKRLIRIVPLYWLGTFAVFTVALYLPEGYLRHTVADPVWLLKSLLFIPFAKGDGMQPLLYLGWTLNYEMLFYLLFALSTRVSHRRRAEICSALILLLVAWGHFAPPRQLVAYFFTRPIMLEFVYGMLCYSVLQQLSAQRARGPAWGWAAAGALALLCLPLMTRLLPPDVPRALRWGVLAAVGFVLAVHGLRGVRIPRVLVLIGDASYALYLFHPYVLRSFAGFTDAFRQPGPTAYVVAVVAVLLCCAIALAVYRYVERPITDFLRARLLPGRRATTGAGA